MKNTLVTLIAASTLALTSCQAKLQVDSKAQKPQATELEQRLNPLQGKEAYELGNAGKYACQLETKDSCFPPFYNFNTSSGTIYLVRLDSEKGFERPKVSKKDEFDQFEFSLGRYEVWLENRGYFAPIGRFDAINENPKIIKLKVYELKSEYKEDIGTPLINPDKNPNQEKPYLNPDSSTPLSPLPPAPSADPSS